MRFESSVMIMRPIQEVFTLVADFENDTKWRKGHITSKRTTPLPIGVGTKCREVIRAMGMQKELVLEVTEFEPNKKVAFTSTRFGPMEPRGTFTFEGMQGSTKVTFIGEPKVGGLFNLLVPLMRQYAKGDMTKSLATLKAHLESGR